jgi:ribonuclease T2
MARQSSKRIGSTLLLTLLLAGCNATPPTPSPRSSRSSTPQGDFNIPTASRAERSDNSESADSQYTSRRRPRRGRPSANAQPGVFDFYLLNLSWSPEFCATHNTSPECAAHPGFVVHGLWPQNSDGTYPENCSSAPGPTNPGQYTNLLPTVSLIEHEWATHGTCSGLAPDAYFNQIGTVFHSLRIPPAFTHTTQPTTMPPGAIIDQFAAANPSIPKGAIALSCGNNYLTAVEVCLTKSLTAEACQSVHTCGATVVKVTPQ